MSNLTIELKSVLKPEQALEWFTKRFPTASEQDLEKFINYLNQDDKKEQEKTK